MFNFIKLFAVIFCLSASANPVTVRDPSPSWYASWIRPVIEKPVVKVFELQLKSWQRRLSKLLGTLSDSSFLGTHSSTLLSAHDEFARLPNEHIEKIVETYRTQKEAYESGRRLTREELDKYLRAEAFLRASGLLDWVNEAGTKESQDIQPSPAVSPDQMPQFISLRTAAAPPAGGTGGSSSQGTNTGAQPFQPAGTPAHHHHQFAAAAHHHHHHQPVQAPRYPWPHHMHHHAVPTQWGAVAPGAGPFVQQHLVHHHHQFVAPVAGQARPHPYPVRTQQLAGVGQPGPLVTPPLAHHHGMPVAAHHYHQFVAPVAGQTPFPSVFVGAPPAPAAPAALAAPNALPTSISPPSTYTVQSRKAAQAADLGPEGRPAYSATIRDPSTYQEDISGLGQVSWDELNNAVNVSSAGVASIADIRTVQSGTQPNSYKSLGQERNSNIVIATAKLADGSPVTVQRVMLGQLCSEAFRILGIHFVGKLLAYLTGEPVTIYGLVPLEAIKTQSQGAQPIMIGVWLPIGPGEKLLDLQRLWAAFTREGVLFTNESGREPLLEFVDCRRQISQTGLPESPVSLEPAKSPPKRLGAEKEVEVFTYTPKPEASNPHYPPRDDCRGRVTERFTLERLLGGLGSAAPAAVAAPDTPREISIEPVASTRNYDKPLSALDIYRLLTSKSYADLVGAFVKVRRENGPYIGRIVGIATFKSRHVLRVIRLDTSPETSEFVEYFDLDPYELTDREVECFIPKTEGPNWC